MKLKHWVFVILALAGGLYLLHNYTSHGGTAGVKQGLGLGNFGGAA
jgi:hypothetical protein